MSNIAVITTFPNSMWDVYGKKMIKSFVEYFPKDITLMVKLDDDLLAQQLSGMLRPNDAIAVNSTPEHVAFIERNKSKDDPQNYRFQPTRFCHKVFTISEALNAILKHKKAHSENPDKVSEPPRYLVWLDADVAIQRLVTRDEVRAALPLQGHAAATLGRRDWPHSECGWLAFDLENGGDKIIAEMFRMYTTDEILKLEQHHDSWAFDHIVKTNNIPVTNLTPDAPGLDVWQYSPMGKWSIHYKGPKAKANLGMQRVPQPKANQGNIVVHTKNALPDETLQSHIEENQEMIKEWVKPCLENNEEIVIVSAGPSLVPEDVRKEAAAGKKIVAVKHAIQRLKEVGITPWACILLDPRPHVADFVKDPDKEVLWFVASQVNPKVTRRLLNAGCKVFGYHAAVGANEGHLTCKQSYAIIAGGSATATRGMYLLKHLGFRKFTLYGYELSFPDKPDLNATDDKGQPKFIEISMSFRDRFVNAKKCFFTEPQLYAQAEEINEIIRSERFDIEAHGDGIVPFLINSKKLADLRNREQAVKIMGTKSITYKELLCQNVTMNWRNLLPKTLRKLRKASNY